MKLYCLKKVGGTGGHNRKQNEPKINITCVLTCGVRRRKDRKVTEASRSAEGGGEKEQRVG